MILMVALMGELTYIMNDVLQVSDAEPNTASFQTVIHRVAKSLFCH